MSASIASQVARRGAALLVGTLALVGVGTGAVLHVEARQGLDEALLAAAHAHAHPAPAERWRIEHSASPITAWVVDEGGPELPAAIVTEARRTELPVLADVGTARVALITAERGDGAQEHHALVAARAPRVSVTHTVGPFAAAYSAVAAVVVALAIAALQRTVRQAMAPVARARDEAAAVLRLGEGKRLTVDAPDELRALLVGVNALLDRLDDAHQAQGRFTAEAAHELRTPVTVLLGELDVTLRRERSAEDYRLALVSARAEVERLRRVVEGLLALARLDAGEADRHREPVRASELVADAIAAERGALRDAGCAVRSEVADDPEVTVHKGLVITALGNLIRNAARHAPGADVLVRVGVEGTALVFDVCDRGPGVPPEEREALFGRFARAGEARRHDPAGLGLGLPIARQIARRHGGDCTLHEAPGGGARARLTMAVDWRTSILPAE